MPQNPRILLYLLRRDLRLADSPVFHHLATSNYSYTHLLPVYYLPPHQIEVSGFLRNPEAGLPYPEARSRIGRFWRTGPLRAQFIAESVWDLKGSLESIGSGLLVRVGRADEIVERLAREGSVQGVWMSSGIATEEKAEERSVRRAADRLGIDFKLWSDESYLIHPEDLPTPPREVSDVFTSFRKSVEPLRDNVRAPFPAPRKLLPFPANLPEQADLFTAPTSLDDFVARLKAPLEDLGLSTPPSFPEGAATAHPFQGGETQARSRLDHLVQSGAMSTYKDTRNGLLGTEYSTKLSAWLALGCITARQIHSAMYALEEGSAYADAPGHGKGENKGTAAVRFELLWRDYMALCALKYGADLFSLGGFAHAGQVYNASEWSSQSDKPEAFQRWQAGSTGLGLIDASQRELFLTGYTSNRTRQNVACFLAKDLGIDWRLGAEWYESMLIDYEVASNWGNWQYNAGVGNDPRGVGRKFNPVKQAHDYDKGAKYCRTWLPELREAVRDESVWQAWQLSVAEKKKLGVAGLEWVERPLKRIQWGKSAKTSGAGNRARKSGKTGGNAA
ncbi:hypothetical protein HWV62_19011 [Athelia sp. TMB]|nr:hypothetical protein HWV62_19011 [Athelia sp. TMB]